MLVLGDMLGVGLSTDGGKSWQPAGFGLTGYEMADATWHPSNPELVWVGSMSGPFLSRDGGMTYESHRNGMPDVIGWNYSSPVERVLFDPRDADRLIAFGGSSRLWKQGEGTPPRFGRVWGSTDAGQSWKCLSTLTASGSTPGDAPGDGGLNIVSADFLAGSSTDLLAAVYTQKPGDARRVYKSVDGGRTWAPSDSGLPPQPARRLAVHPTNPRVAWVALDSAKTDTDALAAPGGIWKTTDAGATWRPANNGLTRA